MTLPLTINETLKWLSSLAYLNAKDHSGGDNAALGTVCFPRVGSGRCRHVGPVKTRRAGGGSSGL